MFGHTIIGGKEVLTFNGEPLERDTRSLSQIIEDFKGSAGKFEEFQRGLSMREMTVFKGWLQSMRK
jgi:hypothetical protein